ncbi:MAG TPA: hypothetical protein VEQ59_15055, partial [Polyangiaceae bacterium]|nr:hypothetical protein [Polyangiaceae bacterium]
DEHLGRGGWTWYTGSASWMYRIAVEHILGLQRRGAALEVSPCVPSSWTEFEVTYRHGKSELRLRFENPDGVATGVRRIELDGRELPSPSIQLVDDGQAHEVRVVMGQPISGAERARRPSSESHVHGAE